MRLCAASLGRLSSGPARFAYDRDAQEFGIVHFGIGAFHRAHQAWYTDRAMDGGDRNWMIAGVSMRSPAVAEQINPQDGLFSVAERSSGGSAVRVVGAVREVAVAQRDTGRILALLAAPGTRIVSLTITEKGYREDGVLALLAEGLRRRRQAGLAGLALLSCDNLEQNGRQLERFVAGHCARHDPALGDWIAAECGFPSAMVDRIVPATTSADLDMAAALLGLRDEAAVVTEPFSQWVIEDRFVAGRPSWEKVGAQLVGDVGPYEAAKLRMLNGAHSALAYLGLARGHEFVHQAIGDPALRPLIERLMRREAAASLAPAPGQDLGAYASELLARFGNPALHHRLAQIATDGSQKIPQRWLETLAHHQRQGRQCPAILIALAAWLRHVRGDNGPVDDPQADRMRAAWSEAGEEGIVAALFGERGAILASWRPTRQDLGFLAKYLPAGAPLEQGAS